MMPNDVLYQIAYRLITRHHQEIIFQDLSSLNPAELYGLVNSLMRLDG